MERLAVDHREICVLADGTLAVESSAGVAEPSAGLVADLVAAPMSVVAVGSWLAWP